VPQSGEGNSVATIRFIAVALRDANRVAPLAEVVYQVLTNPIYAGCVLPRQGRVAACTCLGWRSSAQSTQATNRPQVPRSQPAGIRLTALAHSNQRANFTISGTSGSMWRQVSNAHELRAPPSDPDNSASSRRAEKSSVRATCSRQANLLRQTLASIDLSVEIRAAGANTLGAPALRLTQPTRAPSTTATVNRTVLIDDLLGAGPGRAMEAHGSRCGTRCSASRLSNQRSQGFAKGVRSLLAGLNLPPSICQVAGRALGASSRGYQLPRAATEKPSRQLLAPGPRDLVAKFSLLQSSEARSKAEGVQKQGVAVSAGTYRRCACNKATRCTLTETQSYRSVRRQSPGGASPPTGSGRMEGWNCDTESRRLIHRQSRNCSSPCVGSTSLGVSADRERRRCRAASCRSAPDPSAVQATLGWRTHSAGVHLPSTTLCTGIYDFLGGLKRWRRVKATVDDPLH